MDGQRRRPLVAGNWKMNGLRQALAEVDALAARMRSNGTPACEVMICPPATLVTAIAAQVAGLGVPILVGGQDCHAEPSGAHTGDIAAPMLADAGAVAVIVGHSERRQDHGESDADVRAKVTAAHAAGLLAIVCVGETLDERDAGRAEAVVRDQLSGSLPEGASATNTVVAYEPVWAIGTGRTPEIADIAAMHGAIRARLEALLGADAARLRVLYGGSVKAANAEPILGTDDVDGALVGGASLKTLDFWPIIATYGFA